MILLFSIIVVVCFVRMGLHSHEAIERYHNVASMDEGEKREVIDHWFKTYPDMEGVFLASPENVQREVLAGILERHDEFMQANKPKWWRTYWFLR